MFDLIPRIIACMLIVRNNTGHLESKSDHDTAGGY